MIWEDLRFVAGELFEGRTEVDVEEAGALKDTEAFTKRKKWVVVGVS